MRADTVNQWYNEFLRMKTLRSIDAAAMILIAMTDGQNRGLDLDQLANALTAWRMLPTTSHEDKEPWYAPLPTAATILNVVPPESNDR
jgi:hypothetical protein